MEFITKEQQPEPPQPVLVTVEIDEDRDAELMLDGRAVGYFGHNSGIFYRYIHTPEQIAPLAKKGIRFDTSNRIQIS